MGRLNALGSGGAAAAATGWTDDGTVVRLDTATDQVIIGDTAADTSNDKVYIEKDGNAVAFCKIRNSTNGTAAEVYFMAKGAGGAAGAEANIELGIVSQAFSTAFYAGTGLVKAQGTLNGLKVGTEDAKDIQIFRNAANHSIFGVNSGGSTPQLRIGGETNLYDEGISCNGHVMTDSNLLHSTSNAGQVGDPTVIWGSAYIKDQYQTGFIQYTEMTAPGVGAANTARLYAVDNGSGKTQLAVIFATGSPIVLATEV